MQISEELLERWKRTQAFWRTLLHVMKLGFAIMTSKQNVSHLCGSRPVLWDRQKQGRWSRMWKSRSWIVSIPVGLFSANGCRKAKPSVSTLYGGCETHARVRWSTWRNVGKRGRGCRIATVLRLTTHFWFASFVAKGGVTVVPQPPCAPDLAPCDFFCFRS
jgi:hypothetical protein